MKKRIFTLLIAVFFVTTHAFAQPLRFFGLVFEQKEGRAVNWVPFASAYFYNLDDTTKLEYAALSNKYGAFYIDNIKNGRYLVKIVAQGFKPKTQEIQFKDVVDLAKRNNNQVGANIPMERESDLPMNPQIFKLKEIITGDENIAAAMDSIKIKLKKPGEKSKKTYRFLLAGEELSTDTYAMLNQAPLKEILKALGNGNSYIEFYDLSGKYRTIVDGVFNIVFNNKTLIRDPKKIHNYKETTDFFIKK
jgi:hypothetical protein